MSELENLGKFISLILRHKPETIGLELDKNGYLPVSSLIENVNTYSSFELDREKLDDLVLNNSKKRYEYNEDETKIRARQGHSLSVDVDLMEKEPPSFLYHGTAERFLPDILKQGIVKKSRQFVHLSETKEVAKTVGSRHGKALVLTIEAQKLFQAGQKFYLSRNDVWLTNDIRPDYIKEFNKGEPYDF